MINSVDLRLNVQTHNKVDAERVAKDYGDAVCVGVLARDFSNLSEALELVKSFQEKDVLVSIGLGDGAANQWERALHIATQTLPFHLNQVFPTAAHAVGVLSEYKAGIRVNALVSPTENPKRLSVGTGPLSRRNSDSTLPIETALDILLDGGVNSIKLYPLNGTKNLESLRNVAEAAALRGMTIEPTGGIDLENLAQITTICLESGCKSIMPHVYSAVKDSNDRLIFEKLDVAIKILRRAQGQIT
jgi:2-dehydro-3-deoxy-phosphogluconate aldolase